jgi:hypothetical protein
LVASSDDLFELGGFSVGEIGVALAIFFDEGDQVVLGPDCGLNRVANGGVIFAEITDGAVIGAALASESDGLEVFGAGVFEAATEASMARTGLAKVTWSSYCGRQQSVQHSGSARRFARADGRSGSARCGAELLPCRRRGRAPRRMEQSIHPPLAAAERAALRILSPKRIQAEIQRFPPGIARFRPDRG